jgi:hypothetical protein
MLGGIAAFDLQQYYIKYFRHAKDKDKLHLNRNDLGSI